VREGVFLERTSDYERDGSVIVNVMIGKDKWQKRIVSAFWVSARSDRARAQNV
jgi:hypothetical protein